MTHQSHFSKHSKKRIKERTKMDVNLVSKLLDTIGVNMGSKPGLHKNHMLLYSIVDSCYFVIIQDNMNGEIISFLPKDYHENLAWKVTEQQYQEAHKRALAYDEKQHQLQVKMEPTVFAVWNGYTDVIGNYQKIRKHCSVDREKRDIKEFMQSEQFQKIAQEITENGGYDIAVSIGLRGEKCYLTESLPLKGEMTNA